MHNRSMRTEARVLVYHPLAAVLSRRVFYSSRLSFHLPQCVSLRSVLNSRTTSRFSAFMNPIFAIIGSPPRLQSSRASMAVCHSGNADSFSGKPVM